MIKVRLKEIADSAQALNELPKMAFNQKFGFHLARLIKPIKDELSLYQERMKLIIEEYKGTPAGNKIAFKNEVAKEAAKAIHDLEETEVEIKTNTVSLQKIEDECRGEADLGALLNLGYFIIFEPIEEEKEESKEEPKTKGKTDKK